MSRPLLLLAAAFGTGALAGAALSPRHALWLLLASAAALPLALAARRPFAVASLLAAAAALGAAGASLESTAYDRSTLRRLVADGSFEGVVVCVHGRAAEDARETADRWTLVLDVDAVEWRGEKRNATGRARIDVRGASARSAVIEGDAVSVWAELYLPRGYGTPGAFDTAAAARRDGVHVFGAGKSPRLVERVRGGDGLAALVARVRAAGRARLQAVVPAGPEQGLVRAMVLGDRTGVDRETAEAFRAAGTYHVLALSGAQVAIVAAVLTVLLGRVEMPRVARAALVCGALAFYAALVGGDVPVARAAWMAGVLVAGRCLDLDGDLANLLGLAALLLVADRPSAVTDVGFQLSFAATLGLLVLTPPLVRRVKPLPLRIELALAGSLAAQLALAPLLLAHFNRLAPAALLLNLAAVPLSAAVLLIGTAAALCPPAWPLLPALAGNLAWIAAHALLRSAEPVRWLPGLDLRLPGPPFWAVALFAGGLAVLAADRWFRRGIALTAIGLLALVHGRRPPAADGRLHVAVLDVGQGDAIVVRTPRGRVWVVDGGGALDGRFDVGEAVVAPYLWSLGVRRLEGIVLTHAHPDHAGGLPFLLRAFTVGEFWDGHRPRKDRLYAPLDEALTRSGATERSVGAGVRADWDGVSVDVLGPPPGPRPWGTRNDDSLVLRLSYREVRMLLTGDIESGGEGRLDPGPAALLKVPHHGSRSSSTPLLLDRVDPGLAVVSVGRNSRFGHPHPEVLGRYLDRRIQVLRTDRQGTVTLSTDGGRLVVRTWH